MIVRSGVVKEFQRQAVHVYLQGKFHHAVFCYARTMKDYVNRLFPRVKGGVIGRVVKGSFNIHSQGKFNYAMLCYVWVIWEKEYVDPLFPRVRECGGVLSKVSASINSRLFIRRADPMMPACQDVAAGDRQAAGKHQYSVTIMCFQLCRLGLYIFTRLRYLWIL